MSTTGFNIYNGAVNGWDRMDFDLGIIDYSYIGGFNYNARDLQSIDNLDPGHRPQISSPGSRRRTRRFCRRG